MNLSDALFSLLAQQPGSEPATTYLRQQATTYRQQPTNGLFYRVFTAMPRHVGKAPINVAGLARPATDVAADNVVKTLGRLRPGLNVVGWATDRLARVWWLRQLTTDDQTHYVQTITALFRSAELNELVALYSALPVLAHPDAWRFQATEGVRSNIADVQDAIMLRNPYPAEQLDELAWNQLVMKAFFTEKDVSQIIGLAERNNARLRQTLADYVSERRAAGRSIPAGVDLLL